MKRRSTYDPHWSDPFLPASIRRGIVWLLRVPLLQPAMGPIVFVVRVAWLFYKELSDDKAFLRAAGMAYATLVALVPTLVLVFGVLGAVGVLDDPGAQDAVYDAMFGAFFGNVDEIRDALVPFLQNIDFRALGVASTLALLVVAARLFLMVEQAYSEIFQVRIDRWFTARILNFYFAITAVPLVLVATLDGAWRMGFSAWQSPLISALQFGVLLGALKFFPCTRVRWGPALLGATTSWVLLEIQSRSFSWYISWSYADPEYPLRVFYGSLILIPIFLLWLYFLWLVVLLGVEVAHVAQNYGSLVEAERLAAERARRRLRSPSLDNALEVLMHVAQHFDAGGGAADAPALGARMRIPQRDIDEIATVLEEAQLLMKVDGGWLLPRPANRIALADVAQAWRALTLLQGSDARVTAELQAALALDGTLADAIGRWSAPVPAP